MSYSSGKYMNNIIIMPVFAHDVVKVARFQNIVDLCTINKFLICPLWVHTGRTCTRIK